jgi:hypothetical protein
MVEIYELWFSHQVDQRRMFHATRELKIGNRRVYSANPSVRDRSWRRFVLGKYYTHSQVTVMTDLAFRFPQSIRILLKLCTFWFDIESVILCSDLYVELYMTIPEGDLRCIIEVPTHVLLLSKAMYGSVRASRQWRKQMMQWLEETTTQGRLILASSLYNFLMAAVIILLKLMTS